MTGLLTGNLVGRAVPVLTSLLLVALIYIGGVARISGAIVAGLFFAPNGFGPTLLDQWFGIGRYAYLIGGLGLVATTIIHPDGLSDGLERGLLRIKARDAPQVAARQPADGDAGVRAVDSGSGDVETRASSRSTVCGSSTAVFGRSTPCRCECPVRESPG